MKFLRLLAALLALACTPSAAFGQSANGASAPAGYAPINAPCAMAADGKCYAIGNANGLPVSTPAAKSTACAVSATTSAATITAPATCTATGSAGTYVVGPFLPQAGYPVRIVATGTWTGSIAVGTSVNGCATVNPLTVAGQPWATFTGNADEAVDVPVTSIAIGYCLSITVSSGTVNAALRQ